jgi:hypothetical protein
MKFDLKQPCKNCPFGIAPTRIIFSCRERAEEIEELAYRRGFPCHLSATLAEDAEDAGFEFGPETQHCAGAAAMFLNAGYDTWPGIGNSERIANRIASRMGDAGLAMAFENDEEFFAANERGYAKVIEARRAETGTGSVHESTDPERVSP